jgi:hypothetical protein
METQLNRRISWGRIVIAAVLSEVGVMAVLMVTFLGYRFVVMPGHPASFYTSFDDAASYYLAPLTAGTATLLAALWACRSASGRLALHGALVGSTAVLLTGGFIFFTQPKNRLMYGVSFVLRVIGGWTGGMIARRLRTRRSALQFKFANSEPR